MLQGSSCSIRQLSAVTTSNFVSLNQLLSAKVSNGNTAAMSEIRSNLTIKTPERRYWFFFSFYIVHRRSFWLQRWCCTYFTHLFWCFHRWHSASNADTVRERLHIWLLTLSKSKRISLMPTNCLSVFDHFVELALKELMHESIRKD